METINDIVREIRAQQNGNVHTISAKEAYALADRIEKAHEFELAVEKAKAAGEGYSAGKQSVTDCNHLEQAVVRGNRTSQESRQVGNAAAMREALRKADIVLSQTSNGYHSPVRQEIKAALSAPPRNCDLYTTDEAIRKYDWSTRSNQCGEAEWIRFIDWLFAEAKGGAE